MTDGNDAIVRPQRSSWLTPLRVIRARPRLLVSALIAIAIGFLLPTDLRIVTRALIALNIGVAIYLVASVKTMAASTHETIRRYARLQDEGRFVILILTIAVVCASMGAIVVELGPVKEMIGWPKAIRLGLTILTLLNSWLFLHLTFTFHYAHEYYLERAANAGEGDEERGGLRFPGTPTPHYLDFLYFSYVIGVACQTADIETRSSTMRAVALAHGVISFFYNTSILALMVNISSGFI